jgi:glycosyltransferase involved in cell wall biosynthesis
VIVVDNGSTDQSADIAQSFDQVTLLRETDYLGSPYSARNRGIEAASGSLIALLDATCVPAPTWLEEGVKCVGNSSVDFVAGHVEFTFSDPPTAGEFLDSMTNIRMRDNVRKRGVAKTANLFVPKSLFEAVGLFSEGIRSGGDVQWTSRVTKEGYTLGFCEDAVVRKPARGLSALIKKQWRVGRGKTNIENPEHGKIYNFARSFNPPKVANLKSSIESTKYQRPEGLDVDVSILNIWLCKYIVRILGRISRLF